MREALALAIAVPFLVGAALAPEPADRDVVFRFADPAIVESSGLVVTDDLVVTVNDSGDAARVFAVDPGSGETVGVTTFAGSPTDVEALAPAGPGDVWVGDIGDNADARDDVTVTRVPVGRGDRGVTGTAYRLVYPDGPADAEALLAHPVTGRLFVVTKGVLGGTVYAAPSALRAGAPNRLRRVGDAPGLVTDGAFFPDGRHLVLRTYSQAVVLSFPDLDLVDRFPLPRQKQGEGIAVDPSGTVYASSEGVRSSLLRIALPAPVRAALAAGPESSGSGSGSPSANPSATADDPPGTGLPDAGEPQRSPGPWLAGFLVLGIVVAVLLRALRPR